MPYDATTRHLLDAFTGAWLEYLGLAAAAPLDILDTDLSTVAARADKVVRINAPMPWLVHIELQASYDPRMGRRMLWYNALLNHQYDLAVQSVVVLLRRKADGPWMTEVVTQRLPDESLVHEFRYRIVRAWEQPVERVLAGRLGTLPLAPLADLSEAALPEVIRRIDERVRHETTPAEAARLREATLLLMGLRYDAARIAEAVQGAGMIEEILRESSIVQAALARGKAEGQAAGKSEGARALLLHLGSQRFGPPTARISAALAEITELEQIERLGERLLEVASWEELLATA